MMPNELFCTFRFGLPKFGWLKMSNASVRNCRLNRSVSFVFLTMDKSVLTKFGPVKALRPRLPKWSAAGVAPSGRANAAPGVAEQSGKVTPVWANGVQTTALLNH